MPDDTPLRPPARQRWRLARATAATVRAHRQLAAVAAFARARLDGVAIAGPGRKLASSVQQEQFAQGDILGHAHAC